MLSDSFNLNKEAKTIVKSTGSEFFKKAQEAVLKNWPNWSATMKELANSSGKKGKDLFQPIRVSITGQESGPKLDQLSNLLGKERILERLDLASKI